MNNDQELIRLSSKGQWTDLKSHQSAGRRRLLEIQGCVALAIMKYGGHCACTDTLRLHPGNIPRNNDSNLEMIVFPSRSREYTSAFPGLHISWIPQNPSISLDSETNTWISNGFYKIMWMFHRFDKMHR
jgi:hypothetical protein